MEAKKVDNIDKYLDEYLSHIGVSILDGAEIGSGRYPRGSGKNPNQHSDGDFLTRVEKLRKENPTYTDPETNKTYKGDTAVAKILDMSTTEFRVKLSIAKEERYTAQREKALKMRNQGYSLDYIAKELGYNNDSSVRNLLNADAAARKNAAKATAEIIKKRVDEVGMVNVGKGVEIELGVSRGKVDQALELLKIQGYEVYGLGVPQVTQSNQQTNIKVICPPGTPKSAPYDFANVHSMKEYVSHDGGETFDKKWVYPESLDSSRLKIKYAEEGGINKDGVIEIRPGVADLSLGESKYAQVRIMVDGKYYLKGMAMYSDNLPDGVDVQFNTNKSSDKPMESVLKPIKKDPDNPFGALLKEGINDPDNANSDNFKGGQSYYYDKDGNKKLSLINKTREEGDWNEWKNSLSSQFLAKQSKSLAQKQINMAMDDAVDEFNEIMSMTNPTVKKHFLKTFAEECDSQAVHLNAAALPRQRYQVILPLDTIKDTEVYAPNYENGEKVALIRYPHGGTFEIPILTVNNNQKEGKDRIGPSSQDAIGINTNTAARLSGADFDGDTVMVIPCNSSKSKVRITATNPLKELEGFDPKLSYGPDSDEPVKETKDGSEYYTRAGHTYRRMRDTQKQMGVVSNLIMDMTLKGADETELARAVRHSMVVIDAEKHKLDWKASERENGIAELKRKYQGHVNEEGEYHEGASTIITRAKSEATVDRRQGSPKINTETGELIWKTADDLYYYDKKGNLKKRTQSSTKMAETNDAMTLVSDPDTADKIELIYAEYANNLKQLANKARLEYINAGKIAYSSEQNKIYNTEATALKNKLNVANANAPRETQAQIIANSVIKAKKAQYPELSKKEIKKISQKALTEARAKVGAKRHPIEITDKEWEAIQHGAISDSQLKKILLKADDDQLRSLAMPRTNNGSISAAKQNKIARMRNAGYTNEEIAKQCSVSISTVIKYGG